MGWEEASNNGHGPGDGCALFGERAGLNKTYAREAVTRKGSASVPCSVLLWGAISGL